MDMIHTTTVCLNQMVPTMIHACVTHDAYLLHKQQLVPALVGKGSGHTTVHLLTVTKPQV